MNKSITMKLFGGIGTLVISFVLLSWIINSRYLEKYYISQKKETLIKSHRDIREIYEGDAEEIAIDLEILETTLNATITILDSNGKLKYSSFPRMGNQRFLRKKDMDILNRNEKIFFPHRSTYPPSHPQYIIEKAHKEYVFRVLKDPELKVDFLELIGILERNEILLMRVPLPAISESAAIANNFLMYIGMILIILGFIWAYIFSKRFSKPILELNKIAQHMASLDFSKKCVIERKDEIGDLSKSINYLSEQLDNAISELNEKNQELTKEIEKERKIEIMRKQFISNVSHELKTPISLIQGYAEGLKDNVIEDEDNRNFYCEVIIDEAFKMDKLVKDLLNLSQMESGFFQLEETDFDISTAVTQILHKYKNIFEEKEIQLEVKNDQSIFVHGDTIRVEQVISNFLNNALNHVNAKKEIKVNVVEQKKKVQISIFNSGLPIPEEEIGNIWTSFYKVDQSRTRQYGGYGLGLSIVRAILELHHNKFGVSNMEEGVLFWFELDKSKKVD